MRLDGAHPVAHGLVDGVAQGARAAGDRPHLGPQQFHAEDVGPLAADVLLAHVDDALQAEVGAGRGGGDAVLAGPGLGDDAPLAHPQRQQGLAERVVDLVRAGVIEVFAFEVDLCPAALLAEPLGEIKRRGPADVMPVKAGKLLAKAASAAARSYSAVNSSRARVSVSGHVAAAEGAKAAVAVGQFAALGHDAFRG